MEPSPPMFFIHRFSLFLEGSRDRGGSRAANEKRRLPTNATDDRLYLGVEEDGEEGEDEQGGQRGKQGEHRQIRQSPIQTLSQSQREPAKNHRLNLDEFLLKNQGRDSGKRGQQKIKPSKSKLDLPSNQKSEDTYGADG